MFWNSSLRGGLTKQVSSSVRPGEPTYRGPEGQEYAQGGRWRKWNLLRHLQHSFDPLGVSLCRPKDWKNQKICDRDYKIFLQTPSLR